MNVKDIRHKACLTQYEFAKVIGVSVVTIMKWERGYVTPSLRHKRRVLAFAKEKNISVE